jgi:hypothetical protein
VLLVLVPAAKESVPNKWVVTTLTIISNRHLLGELKLLNLSAKLEKVQDGLLRRDTRDIADNDKVGDRFARDL